MVFLTTTPNTRKRRFRVTSKLRSRARRRKRQTDDRIDPARWSGQSPIIQPPSIQYELSDKQSAIAAGGLGTIVELSKRLQLRKHINQAISVFKIHLPYDEADHVLNMAFNLIAGGTRIEHLEDRRCDEAYLNALDAERIPDPTTAGDFCRRLSDNHILQLMSAYNRIRQIVWKQQPDEFFDRAIIEADGTQVCTTGQKKEGIAMNYKGQWGYHPLIVTLANTREPLFIANRGGSRPSHEGAGFYFDLAIDRCRKGGFRKVRLRGDTDFALTDKFDQWDAEEVEFVFGIDAMPNLVQIAEQLPPDAWKTLRRPRRQSASPRAKRGNSKEKVVFENGYKNKRLTGEKVAEFSYQPGKCSQSYRVVVLRKDVLVTKGQLRLIDENPYFFYITNIPAWELTAAQIVGQSNERCDQENHISQLKQCCLVAPLNDLRSNWAYMVIASLAWNLKVWSGLLIRPEGDAAEQKEQAAAKRKVIGMDFATFRDRIMMVPAQIIRRGGGLVYRLLSYRPSVDILLRLNEQIRKPLLC